MTKRSSAPIEIDCGTKAQAGTMACRLRDPERREAAFGDLCKNALLCAFPIRSIEGEAKPVKPKAQQDAVIDALVSLLPLVESDEQDDETATPEILLRQLAEVQLEAVCDVLASDIERRARHRCASLRLLVGLVNNLPNGPDGQIVDALSIVAKESNSQCRVAAISKLGEVVQRQSPRRKAELIRLIVSALNIDDEEVAGAAFFELERLAGEPSVRQAVGNNLHLATDRRRIQVVTHSQPGLSPGRH